MKRIMGIDKLSDQQLLNMLSDVHNKIANTQNNDQNDNFYFLQCVLSLLKELEQYRCTTEEAAGAFHIRNGQFYEAIGFVDDGSWPVENGVLEVFITPRSSIYKFKS